MRVSLDYGAVRQTPGLGRVTVVAVAVTTIIFLAISTTFLVLEQRHEDAVTRVDKATWTLAGPPCPGIAPARWGQLAIAYPQAFAYQGIAGVRAHGDVSCSVIDSDGGRDVRPFTVCQFRAPFALRLATPHGDAYFETGAGQPVTVWLAGGQPRCVMGANPANW